MAGTASRSFPRTVLQSIVVIDRVKARVPLSPENTPSREI
jgi:hypothetical protein